MRRQSMLIIWKLWEDLSLNSQRVFHWFSIIPTPATTAPFQRMEGRDPSVWNVRTSKSLYWEKRNPKTDQVTFQPEAQPERFELEAHSNRRSIRTGDIFQPETFELETHSNQKHIQTGDIFQPETFKLKAYSTCRFDQEAFQPDAHSNGKHNTGDIRTGGTFQPEAHSSWRHIRTGDIRTGDTFQPETHSNSRHIPAGDIQTEGTFDQETHCNRRYILTGDILQQEVRVHLKWRHIPNTCTLKWKYIPTRDTFQPEANSNWRLTAFHFGVLSSLSVNYPAGQCSSYTPRTYVREAADTSGSFHEAHCILGVRL